jgi:hypothetical protein
VDDISGSDIFSNSDPPQAVACWTLPRASKRAGKYLSYESVPSDEKRLDSREAPERRKKKLRFEAAVEETP